MERYGVAIGLLFCAALGGHALWRALIDADSIWLAGGFGVLVAATVGAIAHDHRQGYFRARRFGPASALAFATWMLGLLTAAIVLGTPHV